MCHQLRYWFLCITILMPLPWGTALEPCLAAGPEPTKMVQYQYTCTTQGMDLETLRDCGITLLSHVPKFADTDAMKRYIAKAHELGIKLLPYTSAEKAWSLDTPERLNRFVSAHGVGALLYYREVDPAPHPEWVLIDDQGRPSPRYGSWEKNDAGEWVLNWEVWYAHGQRYERKQASHIDTWYMCSSARGYLDAVERGIRAMMDAGFDGVFLDNTYEGRLALCHGPEFGRHEHRPPGHNTDKTYIDIAERAYKTVKSYGKDKILLLNDGTHDPYKPFRDGCMYESYINAFGSRDEPDHWKKILKWARFHEGEAEHDRFVTALSYLSKMDYPDKHDCFYTYACAQLSNFKWTATSPRRDIVRLLYRAELILPTGPMLEQDGLWYRAYDRGLVVVNPDRQRELEAWLPLPTSVTEPVELYSGRRPAVQAGRMLVRVGPESGRVVVELTRAQVSYLRECATALNEAARQITAGSKKLLSTPPPPPESDWKETEAKLTKWAETLRAMADSGKPEQRPADYSKVIDLLAEIHNWCRRLPPGTRKVLARLRAADEHACRAAGLMTGLELSFVQDRPQLERGRESALNLMLINRGSNPYRIDGLQLDLPKGWEVVLPELEDGLSLPPGERLELTARVQVPAQCKLPQKQLIVEANATARTSDGLAVPSVASCFASWNAPAATGGDEP